MAKKFGPTIKKLQRAINDKFGEKILINHHQFFSDDSKRVIEYIDISKAIWDEDKGKRVNIKVFSSASDVQIVLWLRDYWYELNGWEIPKDNPEWIAARKKYEDKANAGKKVAGKGKKNGKVKKGN